MTGNSAGRVGRRSIETGINVVFLLDYKTEPVIKWIFDKGSKVFVPVMKVSGLIALGLFIIRVLAGIFGWAPPLDTSEPGDFDSPE